VANIRTARRSGLVLRGGRNRRESAWVSIATTRTNITAPSTAVLFTGFSAAALALRPFTIVRVRGQMHLSSDQLANSESYQASLGLAVVSDQALAIGVTAVPTPETDRDSDLFFVYESLSGEFSVSSAISILESGHGKDFDSKAMRKVEDGQDVALTIETSSISNGVFFSKQARMLIKLH